MDPDALRLIVSRQSHDWSSAEVSLWLGFINLANLIPVFQQYQVDGRRLRLLHDQDLSYELGIHSKVIRKKLINWITHILEDFDQTLPPSSPRASSRRFQLSQATEPFQRWPRSTAADNELTKSSKKKGGQQVLVLKKIEGKENLFYKFRERGCQIGANLTCEVQAKGQNVEPVHAQIVYRNGNFYLRNTAIHEHTYLRVESRLQIYNGMCSQMGSNVLQFTIDTQLRLIIKVISDRSAARPYVISSHLRKIQIGRKPTNHVSFPNDSTLSNLHARITFVDRKWYMEDMMTTNGTWAQVGRDVRLTSGVGFKLGQSNHQFECHVMQIKDDQEIEESMLLKSGDDQEQMCLKCKLCPRDILFMPCNHMAVCSECWDESSRVCLICRLQVVHTTKIFRS